MFQPRVFCVKLQLHFGGDIHEISVPAYDGAEPIVADLMNVVEKDFRVPRALQNLVFHGQELHTHPNEPLSRFGIKNLGVIRLVGRMAPPDMIQQINAQYNVNSYQQSNYTSQPNTNTTFPTTEKILPYYSEYFQHEQKPSVGTQYDPPPPPTPPSQDQPPPTPNRDQPPPTPNRDQPSKPATPNREQPPATPNKGQLSERSNGEQQKPPPPTPNSSNPK